MDRDTALEIVEKLYKKGDIWYAQNFSGSLTPFVFTGKGKTRDEAVEDLVLKLTNNK